MECWSAPTAEAEKFDEPEAMVAAKPGHSLPAIGVAGRRRAQLRLVRDSRSDPLKDAQLTLRLFGDQFEALRALHVSHPEELACHHYLLASQPERRFGSLFATIRHALPPSTFEVRSHLQELTRGKVCQTALARILADSLEQSASQPPLAYVLAWLPSNAGRRRGSPAGCVLANF